MRIVAVMLMVLLFGMIGMVGLDALMEPSQSIGGGL